MENKKPIIEWEFLVDSYKNGDKNTKKVLEKLFGKDMFRPKNIMERVKTFDDAVKELGEDHVFVKEYKISAIYGCAYLKLCIIAAALNEGWKPQFTEDEYRYYPYFWFYTQEEIDYMNDKERANIIMFDEPIGDSAGFGYAGSYNAPSIANVTVDFRLCFKTRELAEYAGKQFIRTYMKFYTK